MTGRALHSFDSSIRLTRSVLKKNKDCVKIIKERVPFLGYTKQFLGVCCLCLGEL
jgi:hypothetical protein